MDGYRVAVVRDEAGARLWSRQGKDLTDRFADLARAAVGQLAPGTVIDGEAVIWNGARLDFDLLQRRRVNTPRKVTGLAALVRDRPARGRNRCVTMLGIATWTRGLAPLMVLRRRDAWRGATTGSPETRSRQERPSAREVQASLHR